MTKIELRLSHKNGDIDELKQLCGFTPYLIIINITSKTNRLKHE